jgi:hypothetical protein
MDDITFNLLQKMNLSKVKLVTLKEFESSELLRVKAERSVPEYSWTCASNFMWFLLQVHNDMDKLIYLDADLYFFGDPGALIEELGDKDIMITSHRYTKKYDQSAVSGKYCVQFMVFKNNDNGLKALDWWRLAVLDWCFYFLDHGRLGDQMYLDDWPKRFAGVHELEHLGGGVAPWNVQQYDFHLENKQVIGRERATGQVFPLVFFHFHSFSLLSKKKYFAARGGYDLSKNIRSLIYDKYFLALQESMADVEKISPEFNFGFSPVSLKERTVAWLSKFGVIKSIIIFIKIYKNKLYGQKNKS